MHNMFQLGLIGKSLGHSFSPAFFKDLFKKQGIKNVFYELYELQQIDEIIDILRKSGLVGLNVTVPYKTAVLPFLTHIDPAAASIGAVNCITIEHGIITGYNTDWVGFKESIEPLLQPAHQSALILGTGGSSKAIGFALRQLDIETKVVSSGTKGDYQYADLNESMIKKFQIIINCTPVGMFPNTHANPFPLSRFLNSQHLCYDVIYNPTKTVFLTEAEKQGATIKNGLEMLERQAMLSWQKWRALCDY